LYHSAAGLPVCQNLARPSKYSQAREETTAGLSVDQDMADSVSPPKFRICKGHFHLTEKTTFPNLSTSTVRPKCASTCTSGTFVNLASQGVTAVNSTPVPRQQDCHQCDSMLPSCRVGSAPQYRRHTKSRLENITCSAGRCNKCGPRALVRRRCQVYALAD
jgi:hypothetical protein